MCKTINSLAKNKKRIALFNTLFLKNDVSFCPIILGSSCNNTASGVEIRKKDGEEHIYVSYLPDDEDEGDWLCDILLPSDAFDIASLVNDICQTHHVIPQD